MPTLAQNGDNPMNNVDYVMACVECGENKAWPEYLCTDCDEEAS